MSTYKLIWTGPRDALHTLETLLSEVLWPPADAVTLLKDDAAKEEALADWSLHAYFEDQPPTDMIANLIKEAQLPLAAAEQEALPDRDWVAHALEGLGVVEAGPFLLYGSHDADKIAGRKGYPLQVEANRAFGTGHHPTTSGCLQALAPHAERSFSSVLDLGTGSGILAMAARRLWPEARIVATDLDEPSVDIARENALTNGISDITFAVADGPDGAATAAAPYDLVMANILADPLIAFAEGIAKLVAPGGTIILAGLLARQEDNVRAAYHQAGFIGTTLEDGAAWPILTLTRE